MPYPSKYLPEYCDQLIEHMRKGYSFEAFAADLSVGRSTLYEWEKAHPEFKQAKEIGHEKCLKHWETIALDGVWNHPEQASVNTGIFVFNMKNRFGWRDVSKVDIDGSLTLEHLVLGSMKPGDKKDDKGTNSGS